MYETNQPGEEPRLVDQASTMAQDAASAAQEKASELKDQGSLRLREEFDQRSAVAGGEVRSLAEALRRSRSDLGQDGNSGVARLTGEAAQGLDRVGAYLEQKGADEVFRDVEMFARRRPWLLAGMGVLAGAATARFMKASSVQRSGMRPGHTPAGRKWRAGGLMSTHNDAEYAMRERPAGDVAKDLTRDLSLLMRQEFELARAELTDKARTAARGLGMFAGAALVALCALGALTAFLVLVFALFLPEWAAALIVGALLAAGAYLLVQRGRERIAAAGTPLPEMTIETVKEDIEWTKTRASSARK